MACVNSSQTPVFASVTKAAALLAFRYLSVALGGPPRQLDCFLGYWCPSAGSQVVTAVTRDLLIPASKSWFCSTGFEHSRLGSHVHRVHCDVWKCLLELEVKSQKDLLLCQLFPILSHYLFGFTSSVKLFPSTSDETPNFTCFRCLT